MKKGSDNEFIRKKLETRKAIRKTVESLCFSSEEIESLRSIYKKIASVESLNKVYNSMQNLKNLELWKRLQEKAIKNYDNNVSYQEFTGRVLGLNENRWEYFWSSGRISDIPC
ncbi:hypothetical protein KAT36_00475 [Candidatus Pacearchaeota archaeon]|nr:hypothetical protein [Candidatus Pacearchaeota archaeon]